MKYLTVALILLASSPSFSCPFHGMFFFGDDDSAPDPKAFIGNIEGENSKSRNEKKPQNFYQFNDFKSRLKQWKEKKSEQQKKPSSDTSQAPVVERTEPKENLKQK